MQTQEEQSPICCTALALRTSFLSNLNQVFLTESFGSPELKSPQLDLSKG